MPADGAPCGVHSRVIPQTKTGGTMTAIAFLRPQRFVVATFIAGLLASGAAQAEEQGSWWQRLVGTGDIVADTLKAGDLQLQIDGSGDVQLRRLDANALAVSLSGSGDVVATGRAGKLDVSIAGSGDVTMRELESDDVSVSIAGSG